MGNTANTLINVGDNVVKSTTESVNQGTVLEDAKTLSTKAVTNTWSMLGSMSTALSGQVNKLINNEEERKQQPSSENQRLDDFSNVN